MHGEKCQFVKETAKEHDKADEHKGFIENNAGYDFHEIGKICGVRHSKNIAHAVKGYTGCRSAEKSVFDSRFHLFAVSPVFSERNHDKKGE